MKTEMNSRRPAHSGRPSRLKAMALLALGLAAGASAQSSWMSGDPGARMHINASPNHILWYAFYFSDTPTSSGSSWLRLKTFVGKNGQTVPFLDVKNMKATSTGRCWELSLSGDDYIIYVNKGTASSPIWTLAADDDYGTEPRLYVWLKNSVSDLTTFIRVAPYFTSGINSQAFLTRADKGYIPEASCSEPNMPIVKIVNNSVTLLGAH